MRNLVQLSDFDLSVNLPKDFYVLIESKKWSERRDAIQSVIDVCLNNPSLKWSNNYKEIAIKLSDVVKLDSNVVCVIHAVHCINELSKGLRADFSKLAPLVLGSLLGKFKETKRTVREALAECLDEIFAECGIGAVAAPATEVLQSNANPGVVSNTQQWIYRCLLRCKAEEHVLNFIKRIGSFVGENSSNGDPNVRESSFMVFAGVVRLFGEEITSELFNNTFSDDVRKKKVLSFLDKAKVEASEIQNKISNDIEQTPGPCGDVSGGVVTASAAEPFDIWDKLEPVDITAAIPEDFDSMIVSTKWKERKEALEALLSVLEKSKRLKPSRDHTRVIDLLIELLGKDVNVNVASLAAKTLTLFVEGLRYDFAPYTSTALKSAFSKFKEKKAVLRIPLCSFIDCVGRYALFCNYVEQVQDALQSVNPQVKTQTVLFLSRLWKNHDKIYLSAMNKGSIGMNGPLRVIVPLIDKLSCDSDPDCRDAVYEAIGAMMKAIGSEGIRVLFPEVTRDELKVAKIKEKCESLISECGTEASVWVVKLYETFRRKDLSQLESKTKGDPGGNRLVTGKSRRNEDISPQRPNTKSEIRNGFSSSSSHRVTRKTGLKSAESASVKVSRNKGVSSLTVNKPSGGEKLLLKDFAKIHVKDRRVTSDYSDNSKVLKSKNYKKASVIVTECSILANNVQETNNNVSSGDGRSFLPRPRSDRSLANKISLANAKKTRIPLPSPL